jgi:hypothetical protein
MGSFAGGMSWGGVSVGSWIRDEYVFTTLPTRRKAARQHLYQRIC